MGTRIKQQHVHRFTFYPNGANTTDGGKYVCDCGLSGLADTGGLSAADVATVRAIITGRMDHLQTRIAATTDPATYTAACDKTEHDTLAWVLKLIDGA